MDEETILEWQSPEHHFDRKDIDWYWILGFITLGISVLAFYFGDFLFGVFALIAGATIGMLSYKETRIFPVKITARGIIFGIYLYPWNSFRSFWIEEEHVHGSRILLHSKSAFLPLTIIPIGDEIDLNDLRDIILEFLDEEPLQESAVHRWFDYLIARW